MERTWFELRAARQIRLVRIDTERVTIGVDPSWRERQQVPAPRKGAARGDDQIPHLARFGIDHDAVESPEIAVLIVPDGDIPVGVKRAADRFRIEVTEPAVSGCFDVHAALREQSECHGACATASGRGREEWQSDVATCKRGLMRLFRRLREDIALYPTQGARMFVHAPSFAAAASAALALGVAVNTAMFSVVTAVLLTAFWYHQSGRIVMFQNTSARVFALRCE